MNIAALCASGALLLGAAPQVFAQSTWYVDTAALPPGAGTLLEPFARIDFALAQPQVLSGDTILVAPGTYPEEAIEFGGKDIVIEATGAPLPVRLVGADTGMALSPFVTLQGGTTAGSVLRGLTFTEFTSAVGLDMDGVLIDGATVLFEDCVFESNSGGGASSMLRSTNGDLRFDGCVWLDNDFSCGSTLTMVDTALQLENCTLQGNGNPLTVVAGSVNATDCTFFANWATYCSSPQLLSSVRLTQASSTWLRTTFQGLPGTVSANPQHLGLLNCTTVVDDCVFSAGYSKLQPGAGIQVIGGALDCLSSSFSQLVADRGGAIASQDCMTTLQGCFFHENNGDIEDFEGGAVQASGAGALVVLDCVFEDNRAGAGGAIGIKGVPATISSSVFRLNAARRGTYFDGFLTRGGAIYSSGAVTITDCLFEDNLSRSDYSVAVMDEAYGGALYLGPMSSVFGCVFLRNQVEAGVASSGGALWAADPCTVDRCVFVANQASGSLMAVGGTLGGAGSADHCTVLNSTSSGTGSIAEQWQIQNAILLPLDSAPLGPFSTVEYSLVQGGWPGLGNIDGDPMFWSPDDDFHLLPGSPAVDAGNPASAVDADGSPTDMGAFAYDPSYCGPGCSTISGSTSCLSTINSTGLAGRTFVLGSDLVDDSNLVLAADQLPPGSLGYFLLSPTQTFIPLFGGGQGNLCLGSPQLRWLEEFGAVNGAGQYGRRLILDQLPQGNAIHAGEAWYFQFWFRDFVAGQVTSNTSSGLRVLFH